MADENVVDEKLLRNYYKNTFATISGQMVLKDLENRCFKRDSTFLPQVNMFRDEILINEGKRQVLLMIENMMSDEGMQRLAEESGKEG